MKTIIRHARERVIPVAQQIKNLGVDPEVIASIEDKLPIRRGQPTKTLVAFVDEGMICFGISRCNTSMDSANKEFGRETAGGRAWEVKRKLGLWGNGDMRPGKSPYQGQDILFDEEDKLDVTIQVRRDGMAGHALPEHLDAVFQYFYQVEDALQKKNGKPELEPESEPESECSSLPE